MNLICKKIDSHSLFYMWEGIEGVKHRIMHDISAMKEDGVKDDDPTMEDYLEARKEIQMAGVFINEALRHVNPGYFVKEGSGRD